MKQLAQLADQRWASKPSYLDKPQTEQPHPATNTSDGTVKGPAQGTPQARYEQQQQQQEQQQGPTQNEATEATSQQREAKTPKLNKNQKDDSWAAATPGTPGQEWQPDSWAPTAARR